MTSTELKEYAERLGFGIAYARRMPRSDEVRAYVAVLNEEETLKTVHELRWHPSKPKRVEGYEHALKPNRYTQYDKLVVTFVIDDDKEAK